MIAAAVKHVRSAVEHVARCQYCRGDRVFFLRINVKKSLREWVCFSCRNVGASEEIGGAR